MPPARLDWTRAFDLDGDGEYDDLLDPGAELPTPVDLSIDYASSLQLRVRGSLTGTGSYTYDPDFDASTLNDVTIANVMLTFGDVRLAGTAEFALVKRSVTADVDGTGSGRLFEWRADEAGADGDGAGRARRGSWRTSACRANWRWRRLKSAHAAGRWAQLDGAEDGQRRGLGQREPGARWGDGADHGGCAGSEPVEQFADAARCRRRGWIGRGRSIWMATAQYDDLLDPGAELPTPVDLSIDYASSLQLRVRGSLTGTGNYTYDPDFDGCDRSTDVTITNVMLTFGDVRLAGTAEFALVKRSVDGGCGRRGQRAAVRMAS